MTIRRYLTGGLVTLWLSLLLVATWSIPVAYGNDLVMAPVTVQTVADEGDHRHMAADCCVQPMSSCPGCFACPPLLSLPVSLAGYLPPVQRPLTVAPSAVVEGPIAPSFRPPIS